MAALLDNTPASVDPQSQLLYLLGGMNEKLDNVVAEQSAARQDASAFRDATKADVNALTADIGTLHSKVAVLESNAQPRAAWYIVVGGWAGIAAIAFSLWAVLHP